MWDRAVLGGFAAAFDASNFLVLCRDCIFSAAMC